MLTATHNLLETARKEGFAIGAFNVYTLQGVKAVIETAEELKSPVILQVHPKALELGGTALIALCLEAGRTSSVPVAVHLDHCSSPQIIDTALQAGISSVMADGSHLPYEENILFTKKIIASARSLGRSVEAELGQLSGSEDGYTVAQYEACLTHPDQAADFVQKTGVDTLAVCIGNVHGTYSAAPQLDFKRLEAIGQRVSIPLVLHGTSGLPDKMIQQSIARGVVKFNINTELRAACLQAASAYFKMTPHPELVDLMRSEVNGMKSPVKSKILLFGSNGRAL
jgi:tagatose 1,6-diphosphate aldolase GatY/KbaY